MNPRLAVALVGLLALGATILLMRPTEPPAPVREIDIFASLVRSFVIPMGDLIVVSRPSDCRTDGTTKVALEARLFERFLAANPEDRAPFDLRPFAGRIRVETGVQSPRRLYAQRGQPVVSLSRAGFTEAAALVCVEVFAREERAFFVLLERDASGWRVHREEEAWEAPEPEDFDTDDPEAS